MHIAGLQKMTLLDYPGKVACTVFLQGCNFRCPFCHNSDLLPGTNAQRIEEAQLLSFLKSRRGLLDGVCISGGEPTLQKDLPGLLTEIKALGYCVKLDTNGSRPEVLKALVAAGLVDYVAMDIKNGPERYSQTAGIRGGPEQMEESIRFLLSGAVDYEFRTTVVEGLHDDASITSMGGWLRTLAGAGKAKRLYLQSFVDRESVLLPGLRAPEKDTLERYARLLENAAEVIGIR